MFIGAGGYPNYPVSNKNISITEQFEFKLRRRKTSQVPQPSKRVKVAVQYKSEIIQMYLKFTRS